MQHLLRCPLLENECSLEDLATANEKALHCARACMAKHMTQFGDDGHERRMADYVNAVRACVCFELPAERASSFCDV